MGISTFWQPSFNAILNSNMFMTEEK